MSKEQLNKLKKQLKGLSEERMLALMVALAKGGA